MSWLPVALLVVALGVLAAAEWPRLQRAFGADRRSQRTRGKRKAQLRLLRGGGGAEDDDSDAFAASVQRDLANLPTIERRDSPGERPPSQS
jgi:hypothetical protein